MKNQTVSLEQRIANFEEARRQVALEGASFTERLVKDPLADDTDLIAAGRRYRSCERALRRARERSSEGLDTA